MRFCRSRDDVRIAFATAGEGPRHPERVSRLVLYDSHPYGAFVDDAGEKLPKQARAFSQMIARPSREIHLALS